ncbi:beta strand repeat-containing protein, partial [Saccharibacter floricola]
MFLGGNAYAQLGPPSHPPYVVGADNTDSTQTGINGAVALVKNGTGTVTVTGGNSYTGSTTVNNGTLIFRNTTHNDENNYDYTDYTTVSNNVDGKAKMVLDNVPFSSFQSIVIGNAQGASGEVVAQGSSGNLKSMFGSFVVGNGDPTQGTGTSTKTSFLRIMDGAQAQVGSDVVVGNFAKTSGEVDVVGQGSVLTATGSLYISGNSNSYNNVPTNITNGGRGVANVSDGGFLTVPGGITLGAASQTGFAALNIGPNATVVAGDGSGGLYPGITSNLPPSFYQMTVNNGTIQTYDGISLHTTVNMTLNGTLVANAGDTDTGQVEGPMYFSGVLSGQGGIDKQGPANATLSGNNTFQGGVTVETAGLIVTGENLYNKDTIVRHGFIQIGNGGNTGSIDNSPNIRLQNNDSEVVFNRSDVFSANQHITGSGGVIQQGTGTVIVGTNNDYQGQTQIQRGTLQIGNGGETGSVGTGEIVNDGAFVVNHSNGVKLTQTISGSGDVWQNGSGTTTLAGNNSYTGATHVTNGILALAGSSSISTSAGVRVDGDAAKFDVTALNNHGTSIQTLSGQGQVVLGGNDLTITNGNRTINTLINGETANVTSNTYSGEGNNNTVYIDGNGNIISKNQYNEHNGDKIVDLNKEGSVLVDNQFKGSISGRGGVNITGGQEIFSGQNTYSGKTSVSSGAGLILTGSLQGGASDSNKVGLYNQGNVTVNGGTIFEKSINDNANAILTGENNASFSDIVNTQGRVALTNATAGTVTNAAG